MTRLSHVGLLVATAVAATAVVGLRAAAEDPPSPTEKRLAAVEQQLKALALERDSRFESQQLEVAFLERQSPPIGTVVAYAGEWTAAMEATTGWMLCDGRELDPSADGGQYRDLHAAIGHAHGWDASTGKFRIPDYRALFLRGVKGGRTDQFDDVQAGLRVAAATGGNNGNAVGSLQDSATALPRAAFVADNNGAHDHDAATANGQDPDKPNQPYAWNWQVTGGKTSMAKDHNHTISGGDKETRPVNAYVNWLIKFRAGSAPR